MSDGTPWHGSNIALFCRDFRTLQWWKWSNPWKYLQVYLSKSDWVIACPWPGDVSPHLWHGAGLSAGGPGVQTQPGRQRELQLERGEQTVDWVNNNNNNQAQGDSGAACPAKVSPVTSVRHFAGFDLWLSWGLWWWNGLILIIIFIKIEIRLIRKEWWRNL